MRTSLISLLCLVLACGVTAAPAEAISAAAGNRISVFPTDFQGKWRESSAQCGDMTETGLDISAKSLNYYGHTLAANSIRRKGSTTIFVTYTVQKDELGGTVYSQDWTISYELSADKRTLTETDSQGERVRRTRCDDAASLTTTSNPGQIAVDALIGDWEDGGPACASVRRGPTAKSIVFRAWYCEAGEQSAAPITLERLGDRTYTHRASDLNIIFHSGRMMQADAGPRSRKQFGDGLYVTDPGRFYNRATAISQSSPQMATPPIMPQLRTGAYVSFPTRCAQASNATLEWWNGQFFSGGRKHPAYPRPINQARWGRTQSFVADTKGWDDNKAYRVNILVLSQSMYERDGLRYFHCSEARLPATWRDSTPPQKKLNADAVLETTGRSAAVTPAEFKEWQGNGNSYGYLCTVSMTSGSLTMRSAPAGRLSGSIPNGDTFILMEVRVAGDGETWYRAAPLKAQGEGWVSARFVVCNPEHFN